MDTPALLLDRPALAAAGLLALLLRVRPVPRPPVAEAVQAEELVAKP